MKSGDKAEGPEMLRYESFCGKEAADGMLHNSTALVSLKFKYPAPTSNFCKERVTDVQRGMKTC